MDLKACVEAQERIAAAILAPSSNGVGVLHDTLAYVTDSRPSLRVSLPA